MARKGSLSQPTRAAGWQGGIPAAAVPAAEEEEPEARREGGKEGGSPPLPPHPGRPAGQGGCRGRQLPLRPSRAPPPRGALPASRGQMWTQQLDGEEGRGKEGRGTAVSPPPPPPAPPLSGMRAGCSGRPRLRASPAPGWGWRNWP